MRISKKVLWLGAVCVGLGTVPAMAVIPQEKLAFEQDTLEKIIAAEEMAIPALPAVEEFGNTPAISGELLKERFAKLEKSIPLTYHKTSHEFVEYFIYKKAEFTQTMMEKMPLYFPIFEKTLAKHGLPTELKYLSMIESGLNPTVISHARAGGLWQFMPATGREFGLYQDKYIDERFEPVKATEAACRYLKQLYNIFGDWELALASYNTGPGNVKRAMRRSRGTTFWTIYNVLPRETRSYVPQYVAMNYMMNYGNDHGIYPSQTEFQIPNDTIHVNGYIDLLAFCKNSNIDFEDIKKLNPQITKTSLPDQTRDFVLKVPSMQYTYLVSNRNSIMDSCTRRLLLQPNVLVAKLDSATLDSMGKNPAFPYAMVSQQTTSEYDEDLDAQGDEIVLQKTRTKRATHTVRRGENLNAISKKYRVSVSDLKRWNHLRRNNIKRGQRLVILKEVKEPVRSSRVASNSAPAAEKKEIVRNDRHTKKRYHTVQKGDTLWIISQRYGLEIGQLKKKNRIRGNAIKPGQKLIISS
ncbi:LysM peptidoglycan-binding domain-containing protein [Dyadobacter chenwenxiniae]|uniref:LysM peptidoglycan-binding domain-containing protein n=1 Tax=Dyadobacter chenwenxiniae TaxID=2906456 RepID=A0A9X1PIU0_9BACT|nr:lytic transglycosylase domain-containing protein [Dyadobacter chenwenxiniae]MCF0061486.1 LysM peptidoglycan-binding domain-containing protein [Dyadobacter chenwenxiniae]UON81309.1 LysM peptidoglycan-binding domain-containing protein [Dyadobacter chenwenxiniae]